jgi:hypothetical protein
VERRDRYYWQAKERRESGADKREFEEFLRRDWLDLERRRTMTGVQLDQNRQVYSVEGADAVI